MSRPGNRKNMGKLLKPQSSIGIQNYDHSGDITGTGVDRTGYFAAVAHCKVGTATGSPTTQDLVFKVQHSDELASGYVDFPASDNGPNSDPTTVTISADDSLGKLNLNLEVAKKYLRLVLDQSASDLSGGTSPAIDVSADFVLAVKDEGLES